MSIKHKFGSEKPVVVPIAVSDPILPAAVPTATIATIGNVVDFVLLHLHLFSRNNIIFKLLRNITIILVQVIHPTCLINI